jgi:hypothetical protein
MGWICMSSNGSGQFNNTVLWFVAIAATAKVVLLATLVLAVVVAFAVSAL